MPEGTDNIAGLQPANPIDDAPAGEGAAEFRQLKSVLQNCFGGVDGAITKPDGTKPTAQDFSDLFALLEAATPDPDNPDQPPSIGAVLGEVRAYYGDVANIPDGWALCNGNGGRPDMLGRMLIGADTFASTPLYGGQVTGGNTPENVTVGSPAASASSCCHEAAARVWNHGAWQCVPTDSLHLARLPR